MKLKKNGCVGKKKFIFLKYLATGFFYDHRFFKLLDQDEDEGKTYVINIFRWKEQIMKNTFYHHASGFE